MFHLQLCDNVSWMLRGAEDLLKHLETVLGIRKGGTTRTGCSRFRPSSASVPARWLR